MIIQLDKLTDFNSPHGRQAEIAVMNAVCFTYDLEPGPVTSCNFADYDFSINRKTIELKISKFGTTNSLMELGKTDGRPGGLTATKADFWMFLNPGGNNIAKLRLIPVWELIAWYSIDRGSFETKTEGDKIGSVLSPLNFKNFKDLMLGECDYNFNKKTFDTSTFKGNSFAHSTINRLL